MHAMRGGIAPYPAGMIAIGKPCAVGITQLMRCTSPIPVERPNAQPVALRASPQVSMASSAGHSAWPHAVRR